MLARFFQFQDFQTTFKRECLGGFSTFATMAYILVVNAAILGDAGMDGGAVMVATIIVTAFASTLMGLMTNFPIAIAPAMGVSGYIAYALIPANGRRWEELLAAVFIAGVILLILNFFKIRQAVIHAIPFAMRQAVAGGVGLFLVFVGLKHVGLIEQGEGKFVAPGHLFTFEALFMLIGVGAIVIFERLKIRSAFILAILLCWVLALIFKITEFEGIVALPPSLKPTLLKLDFHPSLSFGYFGALFSIFLVTLLDSSVGLIPLANQAKLLDEKGRIKKAQRALTPDALGTMLGALIGTGSLAIHLESAAGIKAGGRTGWVPIVVSLCFLASLFFYPIVQTIPNFAPAAVLIVLGCMMFREVFQISWKKISDAIPVLVILFAMPLTMSIYNGFSYGFITYSFIKLISGKIKKVHPIFLGLSLLLLMHRIALGF